MLAIVVTLTSVVTYMQNAKSEALMASFKKFIPQKCKVIRGGKDIMIDSKDVRRLETFNVFSLSQEISCTSRRVTRFLLTSGSLTPLKCEWTTPP